jgi:DinB superfamily
MRALAAIRAGFPRLTALAGNANLAAPAVSRWSVGEHLDHVVKVHAGILAYFAEPPVGDTSASGISLVGRIVLFTGHIPRGRGKSPERFLPVQVEVTHLQAGLAVVRQGFSRLNEQLPALHDTTTRFAHPVFGGLTRRQWLRFAEIHQQHHVAIINDILRACATIR